MLGMSWSRKTLGQRISYHEMRTERFKFHDGVGDKIANEIATDINVARELFDAQDFQT